MIPSAHGRRLLHAAGLALLASATIASGYVLKNVKWGTRSVPYYVNAANLDIAAGDAEAAVRAGATAWSDQSTANVGFVYAGTTGGTAVGNNGKNEVMFRNASNGTAIATAYVYSSGSQIIDADIVFWDATYKFYGGSTGCSGGLYIQDTATHEFGHAVGLNHSLDSSATMYATTGYCSQSGRTLAPDDIAGVEAIYPPTATTAPAAPTNLVVAVNTTNPSSALTLTWTDQSSNEDRFLVERSLDGTVWSLAGSVGAGVKTFIDSGLQPSTTYRHRVRAENSAGYSAYAGPTTATTQAYVPTPPGTPTSATPANGATGVSVDVDPAWSSSGATAFDVYFGTTATPPLYARVTSARLVLPTLSAATTYYWRVVALNADGATSGATWSFTTAAAKTRQK